MAVELYPQHQWQNESKGGASVPSTPASMEIPPPRSLELEVELGNLSLQPPTTPGTPGTTAAAAADGAMWRPPPGLEPGPLAEKTALVSENRLPGCGALVFPPVSAVHLERAYNPLTLTQLSAAQGSPTTVSG